MTEQISDDLDKIARRVAKKLDHDDTGLPDLLDGLKVLTAYYVARHKGKNGKDDDPPANGSFAEMKRRVLEGEDGSRGHEH